ncbi:peptidase [Yinghuangia sp. ASG 101]|uniref:peptidase n=1 Tax=Yinghuangia sp. ASG 101 TaxID=2896848 RepID=UPI001E528402|nr:peptidase [Yinghuangia sp. ASG 101]UGQ10872.1 peptidase [Yinghuangia sp. ASG 101]
MRGSTRTTRRARVAAALTALGAALALGSAAPAAAATDPSDSSGNSTFANSVLPGTSFLTAGKMEAETSTTTTASTGEYMYWSFPALAGQDVSAKVTLTLPSNTRTAPMSWRVDVFDGLRRHQPCATGHPQAAAQPSENQLTVECGPRTIRPWSEAWSSDPLPGTYYVRVAATDLAEGDVGLRLQVKLELSAKGGGDVGPDAGQDDALKAPLVPITGGGQPLQPGQVAETRKVSLAGFDDDDAWLSGTTGRWVWTTAGALVAMLLGIGGYLFTRHPRRWFR